MSENDRKYCFNWDLVGVDYGAARPGLGDTTSILAYRLFQFTMRDILEKRFGTKVTDDIFRESGAMAGKAFFERYCAGAKDVGELAKIIQDQFRDLSIGIVRFERVDLNTLTFQLTVDEDLDCSGLPDTSDQICVYDEGFIKGILDAFTGKSFEVKEIDCWCTGERTCRFRASLTPPENDKTASDD